jgi:hypothetical protein
MSASIHAQETAIAHHNGEHDQINNRLTRLHPIQWPSIFSSIAIRRNFHRSAQERGGGRPSVSRHQAIMSLRSQIFG